MKKIYLFLSFLVIGFAAKAATTSDYPGSPYGEAFIFVEGGVEFAVYPDGQFDFYYNPQRNGFNFNLSTPNVNFSYNSGYNYDPYVQYDDFGAVIQIENVPIYYDYYGRIVQAGRITLDYHPFGGLARVGHLFLHYDHHNHFTHYTGYINAYNRNYIYRPWHRYYTRPMAHFTIVYNEPYRAYYHPHRMKYSSYKKYYKKHYRKDFRRSYYRPGERVTSYYRGEVTNSPRKIRVARNDRNDRQRSYSDSRSPQRDVYRNRQSRSVQNDRGAMTRTENARQQRNTREQRAVASEANRRTQQVRSNEAPTRQQKNAREQRTVTSEVNSRTQRVRRTEAPARQQRNAREQRTVTSEANSRKQQVRRTEAPARQRAERPARQERRAVVKESRQERTSAKRAERTQKQPEVQNSENTGRRSTRSARGGN